MLNSIKVNNTDSEYTHSIFDITEYTGKKYATLSDALVDIPVEFQKSGMLIKFIDSHSSKYVHYRYRSSNIISFTNRANWDLVERESSLLLVYS